MDPAAAQRHTQTCMAAAAQGVQITHTDTHIERERDEPVAEGAFAQTHSQEYIYV